MLDKSLCRVVAIWWLRSDTYNRNISIASAYAANVYFNGMPELNDK